MTAGECCWWVGGVRKLSDRCAYVGYPAGSVQPGDKVTVCTGDTEWTVQSVEYQVVTLTSDSKWTTGVEYHVHRAHLEYANSAPSLFDYLEGPCQEH